MGACPLLRLPIAMARSVRSRAPVAMSFQRLSPRAARLLLARGRVATELDRAVSPMWAVVLSITFLLVGGIPNVAYSGTDVFRSSGGTWQGSFGGTGPGAPINTSSIGVADLAFGDFNGDCRTDVFRSSGGKWQVSFGGIGSWQTINTSSVGLSQLRFGDFDGDGRTDVFRSSGGEWQGCIVGQ